MKIVYGSLAKIPSKEANSIHIMKICSALAGNGNDVTLIAPNLDNVADGFDTYSYYGVPNNFTIKKISMPKIKGGTAIYAYSAARYIKRNQFDCIYGRNLTLCCIVAKICCIPVFFEAHYPLHEEKVKDILFKVMIKTKAFKKLVVITEMLKRYFMMRYSMSEDRIYVASDAADTVHKAVKPAKLIDHSKGMLQVGYIGHLYRGKGMEIIESMIPCCGDAFFHIIGGTDTDISFWKERLKKYNNVHFYGFVPHYKTADYGKAMDVLLAPYKNEVRGANDIKGRSNLAKWMSPLKLFEYMSQEKPIICSDLPVLREVLTDGVNAILCPPDDIDAWCSALQRLGENQEFSDKIAHNAYKLFNDKYTWEKRADNLMKYVFREGSENEYTNC